MVRLINIHAMELEPDENINQAPPYAILSHMWARGNPGEKVEPEVLFDHWSHDLRQKMLKGMDDEECPRNWLPTGPGRKLLGFCKTARSFGLDYVWIDTVCINKSVRTNEYITRH